MQPLNPFLKAFFKSSLLSQCTPVQNYILLVPTTEVLLSSCDNESGVPYADLSSSEEFLGSHVLRVPNHQNVAWDESPNMRETRGKAKQYTTLNGRMVVIKDSCIYSNKGFKTHNQAQLLSDTLFYPDSLEPRQWLIYFISRPLVGTHKEIMVPIAILPKFSSEGQLLPEPRTSLEPDISIQSNNPPRKKLVKSFNDLLNNFPMIARQMHPGLENLFKEFNLVFERPLPPLPSEVIPGPTPIGPNNTTISMKKVNPINPVPNLRLHSYSVPSAGEVLGSDEEEDVMRSALETAVTAAIDLFQMVDKQQLSLLGATTDLTGPVVERLIERYVAEQVHDKVLYPRLCALKRADDLVIESNIRQMTFVDISQVGIPIQDGQKGRHELNLRLRRAVDEFRKLNSAGSPQQMMDTLLITLKTVTQLTEVPKPPLNQEVTSNEKSISTVITINADALVSLLLIVVIRAKVRHLLARLSYMRYFIFIDDVDSGEMGYALSTYEAVLSYITHSSAGLRKASGANRKLWQAIKKGHIKETMNILEPGVELLSKEDETSENHHDQKVPGNPLNQYLKRGPFHHRKKSSSNSNTSENWKTNPTLNHVFPWQNVQEFVPNQESETRKQKTVTMDMRSLSSCSETSFRSRATTIDSVNNIIEGDTSIERLSQTQDLLGESLLMMAVQNKQQEVLQYLLSLENYYPPEFVIKDMNNDGTTLLSAAVQLGHTEIIDIILDFLFHFNNPEVVEEYFSLQDSRGRSVAHYLFNAPSLITKVGPMLSWRQKDRNGQTPLFAIFRSYDHANYKAMVETALVAAIASQKYGEPLHLDDHVDAKGNTLLHIVNDPRVAYRILVQCDADVNATNYRKFTPLMVASKYGRLDMVRVLFGDERIDLFARELRGLTAVELAKDDDVRNRIDDLTLFQGQPASDGRLTSVVRSFFVQDATIRLVIKSGAPTGNQSFTITTCRRSLADFDHLANLLALEHPASWLPSISGMRNPFRLISKPSRAVLRDIQLRMDSFLKILLSHSTFATHEMLWEFFLVPDIQSDMMEQRSRLKMKTRIEKIRDEFEPVDDVRDVEQFIDHAREMVRSVNYTTTSVARRVNQLWIATTDLYDSCKFAFRTFSALEGLPKTHINALEAYAACLEPSSTHPYTNFHSAVLSIHSTIAAMLLSLARPNALISTISTSKKSIERSHISLSRSTRWPLGLLDETRQRLNEEKEERIRKETIEVEEVGRELRYTWGVVAGELAGWQEGHEIMGRTAVRKLVKGMVIRERMVLDGMNRALRRLTNQTSLLADVTVGCPVSFDAGTQVKVEETVFKIDEDPVDSINNSLIG